MRLLTPARQPGHLPGSMRLVAAVTEAGAADGPLWVDLPEACAADVPERLDGWLLWLLPHAFATGQELVLDGPVDPELLRNAHELMEIWARWNPGRRPIRVVAAPADETSTPEPSRTGLFFTAGVDSFFTLYHHDASSRDHPEWRQRPIDDLVYVQGFDIPLDHGPALARKAAALERIAAATGKTLLTLATNLRQTGVRQPWGEVMHGPALGGIGLLLGRRFRSVLLSAWFCHEDAVPWGSTGITDPLLSTAHTRTRPAGAGHDRFEKLALLAGHPLALETLHVCWQERVETNCGTCEKCLRTLIALEILGIRARATSFPAVPLDLGRLATVWKAEPLFVQMYRQLRDHAVEAGRDDVAAAINACLPSPAADG